MSPEFRTIPVELSPELDRQLTEIAALREQSEQCTLQEAVREGLSVLERCPSRKASLTDNDLEEFKRFRARHKQRQHDGEHERQHEAKHGEQAPHHEKLHTQG